MVPKHGDIQFVQDMLRVCFITFRLAELVEKETEAYFKMDPDPFDDRHPGTYFNSRTDY